MKKIFLLLSAALVCTSLSAQQISESFEGSTFPPEGWEVSNINTYQGWQQFVKQSGSTMTIADGVACAKVSGTYGAAVNGSYLITPQLKPANGEKLTFDARVSDYASKGQQIGRASCRERV